MTSGSGSYPVCARLIRMPLSLAMTRVDAGDASLTGIRRVTDLRRCRTGLRWLTTSRVRTHSAIAPPADVPPTRPPVVARRPMLPLRSWAGLARSTGCDRAAAPPDAIRGYVHGLTETTHRNPKIPLSWLQNTPSPPVHIRPLEFLSAVDYSAQDEFGCGAEAFDLLQRHRHGGTGDGSGADNDRLGEGEDEREVGAALRG